MQFNKCLCIAICAAAFAGNQYAALADYGLIPPAEKYMVVPDSWNLKRDKLQSNERKMLYRKEDDHPWRIECTYKGTKHNWPIDRFLLADRLDDNIACAGDWVKMTDSYLIAEQKLAKSCKVAIEVVAPEKGGLLIVSGVWTFGKAPEYEEHFRDWGIPKRAIAAKDPKVTAQQFKLIGSR